MDGAPIAEEPVGRGRTPQGVPSPTGRGHRRVATAVGVLVGAGVLWFGTATVGGLPALGGTPRVVLDPGRVADPWQAGWGGRPNGDVVLTVTARAHREDGGEKAVRVLGLAGPGIGDSVAATPGGAGGDGLGGVPLLATASRRHPVEIGLRARVDCAGVPDRPPPDAYRVRLAVGDGGRGAGTTASAGAAGRAWSRAVQIACATWLARRDLTVTAVSARVDPLLPRIDAVLTVRNAGARDAVVVADRTSHPHLATSSALLPVRVPAGAATDVPVTVRLDRCDEVDSVLYAAVGDPVLSSQVNLAALAGTAPAGTGSGTRRSDDPAFERAGAGTAPTGIVLSAEAVRQLGTALSQACGGLGPVSVQIPPGGVRYDGTARVLTLDALVQLTPGRVSRLVLAPDGPAAVPPGPGHGPPTDADVLEPAWTATPELRPDAAGRVPVTVRYRLLPVNPCQALGATLLGVVATLRVPVPAGERILRYSLILDLAQDTGTVTRLCGHS